MNETHPSIEQIVEYLHRELSVSEDAAVHAHLATCPQCERRRDEELALTQALRAHVRAQERELPQGVTAGIRHAVQRPTSFAETFLRGLSRPVVAIPAVAAVAAVVYFGGSAWYAASAPTPIEASFYVDNHAAAAATTPLSDDQPIPAALTANDEAR